MNYTLWHLQQRVNKLIEQQGEDAHCAAWIYTAEDCMIYDENDAPQYPAVEDSELAERIFNDVGNIDYIYTVIQECVDESTEEQLMLQQQELASWQELSPLNCPYSISTSIATPMQLTSKDGHMVVDFYPVKFHTGEIHNRLMLKVVTFCGKTQSKSYINKKDFQYEFDSRTHGYGYQVTDESMIPQFYNSGMGMAC